MTSPTAASASAACRCCGHEGLLRFLAPAWQLDAWADVEVGECGRCGSLTVVGVPPGAGLGSQLPARWPLLAAPSAATRLEELARAGQLMLRVPLVQGPVWLEYRDNWMAISPLQHAWLPTVEGLRLAAADVGLLMDEVVGACPVEHLVLSELIALRVPDGPSAEHALSPRELDNLARRARRLTGSGDCPEATIVLRPAGSN